MRNNRHLLLVLTIMLVMAVPGGIAAQDAQGNAVLSFVADTYGVSADDLVVDYKLVIENPVLGIATQYKLRNPVDNAVYGAYIDAEGKAWTPEAYRAAVDAAYLARYGKLDLPLYRLFEEDPNTAIPVEIWLAVDDALLNGLRGPDYIGEGLGLNAEPSTRGEMVDDRSSRNAPLERTQDAGVLTALEVLDAQVDALTASVTARLAAQGIEVRTVPRTPALNATLTFKQALALTNDPVVSWIYADNNENQDMNGPAQNTHRAPAVWARGYTGEGAKVAVLEDSRAYNNFWLYNYGTIRLPSDPNVDNHATRIMGNIGSSHGFHMGIARGASLYSANATDYSTANLQAAANWSVSQGVDIINNSWGVSNPSGCLSNLGRFFDYRVVVDHVLVTHAAGSLGGFIDNHAMAYNVLAVGAFNDHDTANWNADTMSSFSAWREGTTCSSSNGDREKPDIVAVGEGIHSTRIHPPSIDTNAHGSTSFAAAMVAGEAALMLDVNSNLVGKPEAMRAVLLASAVHNIQGNKTRSEYDGAGGIDAYSAYLTALNSRFAQMTIDPSTWTYYDFTFYANANEPVSCVAAWTSHPNASFTSDPLPTDLDLQLFRPTGGVVASSTSSFNSYEIVRVTTDEAGTWKCRVYKYSSSGSTWEYLGIAVDRAFQVHYDYPFDEGATYLPVVQRSSQ